jgi:ATP-binding protein involved in chromosome partitioning
MINENEVREVLKSYIDPYLEADFINSKIPVNISVVAETINVEITLGYPFKGSKEQEDLTHLLQRAFPEAKINVCLTWKVEPRMVQPGLQSVGKIKNIIAVASGKGGVGKSTTAVNLALALVAEGAKVGILDADIYGPNQPQMLGVTTRPTMTEQKAMKPIMSHGLQSMSIGYLVDQNTPIVWRGPMVTGALLQLLNDTEWDALDYLIIDMPPGTGDVQLTLAQKIPVCGAVIVTTPQDVALLDARKGIEMFYKVKIPVLGIIENMSVHVCSHCGNREPIFGLGGGQKIAREYDVSLLGQLPLTKSIREQADSGCPTVVAEPQSDIAMLYRQIAKKIAARLSLQAQNTSTSFPSIIIENN